VHRHQGEDAQFVAFGGQDRVMPGAVCLGPGVWPDDRQDAAAAVFQPGRAVRRDNSPDGAVTEVVPATASLSSSPAAPDSVYSLFPPFLNPSRTPTPPFCCARANSVPSAAVSSIRKALDLARETRVATTVWFPRIGMPKIVGRLSMAVIERVPSRSVGQRPAVFA